MILNIDSGRNLLLIVMIVRVYKHSTEEEDF